MCALYDLCAWFTKGVPLPPLYMRGTGLQGRFPSRLRVGILVGYNCISCYTRSIGPYPYTTGSFLQSCVANSPDGACLPSVGPTHPVRASTLWASSWVSWGTLWTSNPLDRICEAFRAHHIPSSVMKIKMREFLSLKQGTKSIREYV